MFCVLPFTFPRTIPLTIRGRGTLIGNCEKCGSAVIGGGYEEDCGSIVIDGGIIKAYGNKANLGNGVLAAAIGGGYNGDCGNITITSNITSLYTWIEVVREGLYCIGAGLRGDCNGVVTIGGQQLTFSGVPGDQGDDKGQVYDHEVTMYTNKVIFDSNGGSGTMNPQGIMNVSTSTFHPNNFNPAIHISNNNFSRHGYAFVKWNTEADGSGQDYYPGDEISECWSTTPGASITLYAQWMPNEDYFDQIGKGDSEDDPFEISTAQQLKWLAEHVTDVNKGHPYVGKYFKLMNDISFDYEGLGDTESNFTAIGTYGDNNYNDRYFGGHFDGDNHTISGIRIYRGGNDLADKYQGLFGYLATGAEVKNVILTDAIITGYDYVGGIVGCNNNGTVDNCHVTSSVTIRVVTNGAAYHGGIVGENRGEWIAGVSDAEAVVSNCTSAATLTIEDGLTTCPGYGGIVGYNYTYDSSDNNAIVRNNVVSGATIPATRGTSGQPTEAYGAVVGINECILENNYYTACNVGGVANATGVGCSQYDEDSYLSQSDAPGALPALRDNADNTDAIALTGEVGTYKVCLNDRTLYKDGYWNTICLPFRLTDFTGTPLEGATVMQFDFRELAGSGYNETTVTLTMDFEEADEIWEGSPYIVRWGTPESPEGGVIENPVFPAVRIKSVNPEYYGNRCWDRSITFRGTFKPVNIYTEPSIWTFYIGANNTLYYPTNADFTINAFHAYFELGNGLVITPTNPVKAFVLNFGDDNATSIEQSSLTVDRQDETWYSLDGIRLSKKPSEKGIYIHNGRKEAIK